MITDKVVKPLAEQRANTITKQDFDQNPTVEAGAQAHSNLIEHNGHLLFRFIEIEDPDAEIDQERNERLLSLD